MLISPKSIFHNLLTRYAVFFAIAYWQTYLIVNCTASNPSTSFGLGLTSAFVALWSAVLFVFKDSKVQLKRLQQREQGNQSSPTRVKPDGENEQLRYGGQEKQCSNPTPVDKGNEEHPNRRVPAVPKTANCFWEPYPVNAAFSKRLDWVCDLYTNARGVGWNFQLNCLPPLPLFVRQRLESVEIHDKLPGQDTKVSRSGYRRFDEYLPCLKHHMFLMAQGYLAVDILKTIIHHDPYFWGLIDRSPPSYFPFSLLHDSWIWTRGYRLLVSMSFIWMGLRNCYTLGPLLILGILAPLTTDRSPLPLRLKLYLRQACRTEPWLYPDHSGSYTTVLDRGLAGWWGGWWHQIFRSSFQAGSEFLLNSLDLDGRSTPGQMIGIIVAFGLSGVLHACGSVTQQGETRPLKGPMLFFLLQAVGLISESLFHLLILKGLGLSGKTPQWLSRLANLIWVHAWFVVTGPILVDDFARGGIWLLEPLMISPLRGLGFGVEGDGWYCWEGTFATWHWDRQRWWLSGIAL